MYKRRFFEKKLLEVLLVYVNTNYNLTLGSDFLIGFFDYTLNTGAMLL